MPVDCHRRVKQTVYAAWELFNSNLAQMLAICLLLTVAVRLMHLEKVNFNYPLLRANVTEETGTQEVLYTSPPVASTEVTGHSKLKIYYSGKESGDFFFSTVKPEWLKFVLQPLTGFLLFLLMEFLFLGTYFSSLTAIAGKTDVFRAFLKIFKRPFFFFKIVASKWLLMLLACVSCLALFALSAIIDSGLGVLVSLVLYFWVIILLWSRLILVYPLAADRSLGPLTAIRTSWTLTRNKTWTVAFFLIKSSLLLYLITYMSYFNNITDIFEKVFKALKDSNFNVGMVAVFTTDFMQTLITTATTLFLICIITLLYRDCGGTDHNRPIQEGFQSSSQKQV